MVLNEQQLFILQNNKAVERAKKTGRFTRLSSGQYYFFANNSLYFIRRRDFCTQKGLDFDWEWSKDGKPSHDTFPTFAEAKKALLDYLGLSLSSISSKAF